MSEGGCPSTLLGPYRARMARREPIHAVAWFAWAIAAAVTVELAPNPLYVGLVVGVAAVVVQAHAGDSPLARVFPAVVGLGIGFGLIRLVLTAATVHGSGAVLFTTPTFTLPKLLGGFAVGGPVNSAVLLQAAADGWVIVGVMAVFGAFNAVVSHYELVRVAPRAFYELGLTLTIAIAFVPTTVRAIQAVRDADRARTGGRVVRRGRLLRLVVPILETGMEQAVALAESMDARGFSRDTIGSAERAAGWCTLAALLALGGGFVALVGRAEAVASGLEAAGVLALLAAIALASRRRRPRYRPTRMTVLDWGIVAAAAAAPLGVAVLSAVGDSTLTWTASGTRLPGFDPVAAIAILALAAPALRPRRTVSTELAALTLAGEAT
jgi:energy-coupling factor transport system permease protein